LARRGNPKAQGVEAALAVFLFAYAADMTAGRAFILTGLLCALGCDRAKADWARCLAAGTRDEAVAACRAAIAKDPQSASGRAASAKLAEIQDAIAKEAEERRRTELEAARLLEEFHGRMPEINTLQATASTRLAAKRPDEAAKALGSADAILDVYSRTSVAQSMDYTSLRKSVAEQRTALNAPLALWKEAHPTVDDLIARCEVQSAAVNALLEQAEDAKHQRSGQPATVAVEQLKALTPQIQAATRPWQATTRQLTAVDPQAAIRHCQVQTNARQEQKELQAREDRWRADHPPVAAATAVPSAATTTGSPTAISPTAAELPPEDLGFVDTRGGQGWGDRCWTHLKSGQLGWAKAECDRAMAMNPASPQPLASLLYNEGLLEQKLGHTDAARGYFQRSVALRPNPDVQAALDALDR
jgi:tetratricopeptide (TPR) repeat protein